MKKKQQIILEEHQKFYDKDNVGDILSLLRDENVELCGPPSEFMGSPKYLGINSNFEASYYVGAAWLIKNRLPVIVRPKHHNIDLAEMLIRAFTSSENEIEYFSKCYSIDFEESSIEIDAENSQLTPLLVIHYIALLEKLIKRGLKKDYISITNNLKGKLKGRLLIHSHFHQNIIPKREDRNVCQYQIYTADIPINRLLKKALLFADRILLVQFHNLKQFSLLKARINKLISAFDGISDNIEISKVKNTPSNVIFRYYSESIRVAKDILRNYDYSLSNISSTIHSTPPFWIDMSRLFEMYVLSLLREAYGTDILFQVKGHYQVADFLHKSESLVIDAKYKYWYSTEIIKRLDQDHIKDYIKDIREISGNARDLKIIEKLKNTNDEPKCIIIFPSNDGISSFNASLTEIAKHQPINQFSNFFKIPIKLPLLSD